MSSNKKLVIENDERLQAFWGQVESGDIEIDAVISVVGEMLDQNPRVRFVDKGSPRFEKGVLTGHHKRHLGRKKPYPKKRNAAYIRECMLAHLYTVRNDDIHCQVSRLIALGSGRPANTGVEAVGKSPQELSDIPGISALLEDINRLEFDHAELFSGELYDPAQLFNAITAISRDPINTRHLRLLASILFEKQIVVLEQWAVSSATFILVAGRVLEGYRHRRFLDLAAGRR
jgi:hypothetical protein